MKHSQRRSKRIQQESELSAESKPVRQNDTSNVSGQQKDISSKSELHSLEKLTRAFLFFIDDVNYGITRPKPKISKAVKPEVPKKEQKIPKPKPPTYKRGSDVDMLQNKRSTVNSTPEESQPVTAYFTPGYQEGFDERALMAAQLLKNLQFNMEQLQNNPELIAWLNNMMQGLNEGIQNQGMPFAEEAVLEPELAEEDTYPLNCTHVRISYFIWDRQNHGLVDPTELGRKYKEIYLAVT